MDEDATHSDPPPAPSGPSRRLHIAGRPFMVLRAQSVGGAGQGGFTSTSPSSYGTPRG